MVLVGRGVRVGIASHLTRGRNVYLFFGVNPIRAGSVGWDTQGRQFPFNPEYR